jgi:hypothetical protein
LNSIKCSSVFSNKIEFLHVLANVHHHLMMAVIGQNMQRLYFVITDSAALEIEF